MAFDYSRFLCAVESRARRLHGLSAAARTLAVLSFAAAAGILSVRLLRVPLPDWGFAAFAVPLLVAASTGYLSRRSFRPETARLLLRIDDALDLNARLSSLFELRQREEISVFRRRIESAVRDRLAGWQSALPIGRRTVLEGSAGACGLALAIGLAFIPLPAPSASPLDVAGHVPPAVQGARPEEAGSFPAPATEAAPPLTVRTEAGSVQEGGTPTLDAPDRDATLEDVMRDLSGMSPDDAVLIPIPPEEIEELARLQSEAMRAVSRLLEEIQDRLENAPPSEPPQLTEQERESLQRELDRGGLPPELQEGLNELMNEGRSRSVEEIVEQLLDQLADEENTEGDTTAEGEPSLPQSTAVAPSPQDIEELMDELGQSSSDEEVDAGIPAGPKGRQGPSDASEADDSTSMGDAPGIVGAEGEDLDPFGGSEGSVVPPGEEEEREAGFIREEERAKIGSEGEFVHEFVTEGVPIERTTEADEEGATFRVSYDRIASILRERGVPDGAIEIVRTYFSTITEGGS